MLGLKTTEEMRLLTIHKENVISMEVVDKHAEVFNDDLGRLSGIVHLEVDPNHKPCSCTTSTENPRVSERPI